MNNNYKAFVKASTQALRQDLIRSPFHDIKEFNDCHGKLFSTDATILNANVARPVPFFQARNLLGERVDVQSLFKKQRVSVLMLSMSSVGGQQVDPFRSIASMAAIPMYDVHVTIGSLKGLLLGWFVRRQLRGCMSVDKWSTTMIAECKSNHFHCLGAYNRYGGYVYLVDAMGRARWRSSGHPTTADKYSFQQAIKDLQC